jgi:hypothetical protein
MIVPDKGISNWWCSLKLSPKTCFSMFDKRFEVLEHGIPKPARHHKQRKSGQYYIKFKKK